jgi:hypothetical protein
MVSECCPDPPLSKSIPCAIINSAAKSAPGIPIRLLKMNEGKTSKGEKKLLNPIIGIIILVIVVNVGIGLFGGWFKGDSVVLKSTADAQKDLHEAVYLAFHDFARLDIRADYTVRAYISKNSYMSVGYFNRAKVIKTIGRTWCGGKGVVRLYLPKVILRDDKTGEDLGSYWCLLGLTRVISINGI